jgi:hypothetical protein
MLYVQFKKVQIRDYEYLLCNQLYHKLVENGRNVDYTECYGSPCNTFHLITKRIFLNKHFSDIDLFLIYFFYIFLIPNLTHRSWNNHQLKPKNE